METTMVTESFQDRVYRIRRRNSGAALSLRAFSLAELLAAIAILVVLAGLLLPAMKNAGAQARSSVCQAHLRHIAVAVQSYAVDNGGLLPALTWDTQYKQMNLLRPYIADLRFFRCPSATPADSGSNPNWSEYYRQRAPEAQYYTDYKISEHWEIAGRPVSRFPDAQWLVVAAEIDWTIAQRHGTGQNLAFLDGHVVWMSAADYTIPATALRDNYGNYPWYNWGVPR